MPFVESLVRRALPTAPVEFDVDVRVRWMLKLDLEWLLCEVVVLRFLQQHHSISWLDLGPKSLPVTHWDLLLLQVESCPYFVTDAKGRGFTRGGKPVQSIETIAFLSPNVDTIWILSDQQQNDLIRTGSNQATVASLHLQTTSNHAFSNAAEAQSTTYIHIEAQE